jgi:hypothetical protein
MKFAFFTHWHLTQTGVKSNPEQTGNYSPEGMLPYLLDADVFNFVIPIRKEVLNNYDWIILNNDKHFYDNKALLEQFLDFFFSNKYTIGDESINYKKRLPRLCIVQEGPILDWQTWSMERQWAYLKIMELANLFLCNNEDHIEYYKQYTRNVGIYKPPIDLEKIINLRIKQKDDRIVLNGNFKPWYNAHSSLKIANDSNLPILMQSMGQSQNEETQYLPLLIPKNDFGKIPYVPWHDWMKILSEHKYAINMMTAVACGTFSMNCAAVGTLCIGNEEFDTQKKLFPNLSIKYYEIEKGKKLLRKLIEDESFRKEQERIMNERIKEYDVDIIKKELLDLFEKVI